MVETRVASEEAAHKEYIVHLPPKWQRFHERDGARVRPLLKKKSAFVHILASEMGTQRPLVEHAPAAAASKAAGTGKRHRLQALLVLKREAEEKEQARCETARLACMVSKQKEKMQQRREKAMQGSNLLLLSEQSDTTARLKRSCELRDAHYAKFSKKLSEQTQKQLRTTERRVQDPPEGGTARQGQVKLLSAARKVVSEGANTDAFLHPVGRRPHEAESIRKAANVTLQQMAAVLAEGAAHTQRCQERKGEMLQKRQAVMSATARESNTKLQESKVKREKRLADRSQFATQHREHCEVASIYKNVEPMYDNIRNKIDTVEARRQLLDQASREKEELDREWGQYEDALETRFHWTLQNVANKQCKAEKLGSQLAARDVEGHKRLQEAHSRRKGLDEDRRELWKGRGAHEDSVCTRRDASVEQDLARQTGKVHRVLKQQRCVSPKSPPHLVHIPLRTEVDPQGVYDQREEADEARVQHLLQERNHLEHRVERQQSRQARRQQHQADRRNDHQTTVFSVGMDRRQEQDERTAYKVFTAEKAAAASLSMQRKEELLDRREKYEGLSKRATENTERRQDLEDSNKSRWIQTQDTQQTRSENHLASTTSSVINDRQAKWQEKLAKTAHIKEVLVERETGRDERRRHLYEVKNARVHDLAAQREGRLMEQRTLLLTKDAEAIAQQKRANEARSAERHQKARKLQHVLDQQQQAALVNRRHNHAEVEDIRREKQQVQATSLEQRQDQLFQERLRCHQRYLATAHKPPSPAPRISSPVPQPVG